MGKNHVRRQGHRQRGRHAEDGFDGRPQAADRRAYRIDPKDRNRLVTTGRTFVAVDTVGAGEGEFVLIVQGSSARLTPETKTLPVDATIIGIVDTVQVDQTCVFDRNEK